MDQLNHYDYYVARADSARKLAERAANPKIAAIHNEMARGYERTVAQIMQNTTRAGETFQAA